jgi:tRNA threonylcarbamoyl adenosine modification protein YjeE
MRTSILIPKLFESRKNWEGRWTLLWEEEGDESLLSKLAEKVAPKLESNRPFCLWLLGEVGAGKTTFCKSLFTELGVPKTLAITSPTYTYVAEYKTLQGKWFAHLDLYRAHDQMDIEDLAPSDIRTYDGYVLEWPERMSESASILPTHLLEIESSSKGRKYRFWQSQFGI